MGLGPLLRVVLLGQGSEQKDPEAPANFIHSVAVYFPLGTLAGVTGQVTPFLYNIQTSQIKPINSYCRQ